jgi:inhibitor of cysteine peptidase
MRIKKVIGWMLTAILLSSTAVYAQKSKNSDAETDVHLQDKPAFMIASDKPVFVIKLKFNPTTGYSWFLREWDMGLIEPVKHEFEAPTDKKLMGAPGYELWTFRAKPAAFVVPEETTIRFVYGRPWESGDNATQVVFKIATTKTAAKSE